MYWLSIEELQKGIKKLENQKAFVDYSQTIDDVYEKLEYYNTTTKRKVSIGFDDMIANA